jgi:homeodomain-containing protein
MQSALGLTKEERRVLESLTRSRVSPAADVKRARLMVMLDDGLSWQAISQQLPCSPDYINRWRRRFSADRLGGLYARHRGRVLAKNEAKIEARILAWTQKRPTDGSTHWSSRKLGKALDVSHMMVARVWAKHGLKPHRLERYMASNDPLFEAKAADVIGLYLNPPSHAAVFCVDEKTAIQALDRLNPVLPLSPGRAERHGFEYYRHGTLSLYAAFNTQTGSVLGKTAPRHTSAEFVAFLTDIVAHQPKASRSMSSAIISQHTRPKEFNSFSLSIPPFRFTIPRPIPPGLTRWSCGLLKFSATSLPVAFLLLWPI